jgi:gliding motility-associated-like protein
VKIWCQSISTMANTKYEFAAWATSVYNPNPPILQFQVNGNLLGNVFQVEQTVCDWQKFAATWNSGTNTNTEICILNQNIAGGGNDFAIDDISFAPVIETASGADSVLVIVKSKPKVQLGNDTSICQGAIVNIGTTLNGAYSWSTGATASSIEVGATGVYNLQVKNTDGCIGKDTIQITAKTKPNVVLSNVAICEGDAAATFDAGQGFTSYIWSDKGTGNSQSANGKIGGSYTVKVVDANGCKDTASATLTVNAKPNVILNNAVICEGDAAIVFDAGAGYSSYLWSDIGAGNTQKTSGTIAGTYTVNVVDAKGCKDTASATLTINTKPNVSLSSAEICEGDTVVIFDAGAGYSSYLWSDNGTGNTQKTNGTIAGTYTVKVVDAKGCKDTASAILKVNKKPTVQFVAILPICKDFPSFPLKGATPLGGVYEVEDGSNWKVDSVFDVPSKPKGNYKIRYTYKDANACANSVSASVVVNDFPKLQIEDQEICEGHPAVFDAGSNFINYRWSTGSNLSKISAAKEGVYSVSVIDHNGCRTSDTMVLKVNALPIVDLGESQKICSGESVTLESSTTGDNYLWNDGSKNKTLQVKTTGTYSLNIIDSNLCVGTDHVEISVIPLPKVNLGSDQEICEGKIVSLSVKDPKASYYWSTGEKKSTISVGATNTITLTQYYDADCLVKDSVTVTVLPFPKLELGNDTTLCLSETFDGALTLNAGSLADSYLWSTGSTNSTISIEARGTYSVSLTNGKSCTVTDQITIDDLCKTSLFCPSAFTPNNDGNNDVFYVKGANVDYFQLLIFNRWGDVVFESDDMNKGWDGTVNENIVQQDVYVVKVIYSINREKGYKTKEQIISSLTVIR